MNDDAVFRWVMVAGFAAVVGIIAPHRVKAGTREKLDRRKEGAFILATLRPVAAALWISIIAYMIRPASMAWSAVALPVWMRWSGAGFCVLCVALLIWTLPTLGTNLTDTVVTREHHTLVTRGPYRWIRHPFYCGDGTGHDWQRAHRRQLVHAGGGAVVFALLALRSRVEEEQLAARFGDVYREYSEYGHGRFLPKL
jgi:protein-S-isoprenylcysteine O-methyltransferase Ste14